MTNEKIISIAKVLLIILWMYAAGTKILGYHDFIFSLTRQPLPDWTVPIVAVVLPVTELGIAITLGVDKYLTTGFLFSFILMTVFTVYVGLALSGAFGQIPCSCGGIISALKWKGHLIFNLIYALIALTGWTLSRHQKKSIHNITIKKQLI